MEEFSKKYDKSLEAEIYKKRMDNKSFQAKIEEGKDNFFIGMPPPNVTGFLHIGHALTFTIEDSIVRYNRMKGKNVLRIPGTDHAGISTQVVVEKKIWNEEKLLRQNYGREKFINKIWDWVKISRSTIVSQIKQIGSSCDWSQEQFTLSEKLSRAVRKSFSNLYFQNKIYKGNYIINWCSRCQTVLSDVEVIYEDEKSKLYYIRYFIEGKGDNITVATVRPETIFGDVAVAVNPKDKRFKKFIGKNVLIPIVNRPIPVIADENVDVMFGTGALKITPAHDPIDYEIGKKHGLPMDKYAIDKNGKLTDLAGEFAGKEVDLVLDNIIQYLTEIGNLEKIEDYETSIPRCERCNTRIQPLISEQWFVDVKQAAESSIQAVENGDIKILPDKFNKVYYKWLNEIRPWCISRQLRWGHRIPVWYCSNNHKNIFDEDNIFEKDSNIDIMSMIVFNLIGDSRLNKHFKLIQLRKLLLSDSLTPNEGKVYQVYLNIYKLKFENNIEILKFLNNFEKIFLENNIESIDNFLQESLKDSSLITKSDDNYTFNFKCKECGLLDLKQENDVLDTWFSSALWPFSILGWPENTVALKNFYPNSLLETGYDILFFWVARMMMMGFENIGKKSFDYVYLHGLVRDEKGIKMSKSLGNVVDPLKIISEYSADSLRLSLITGATPGNDVKFSYEKVDYSWRFINKLWNASRFIHMKHLNDLEEKSINYDEIREYVLSKYENFNDFDKWILGSLSNLIDEIENYNSKYMLGESAQSIIKFAWHNFCDWYIEISKINNSSYSGKILLFVLGTVLKLLHPFIPHVTEKLWEILGFDGLLISSSYPKNFELGEKNYKVSLFMDIITELRNLRQLQNYKPHEKVGVLIQGNSSITDFVKKYLLLLEKLVNSNEIILLKPTDEIDHDYSTGVILDVKIGIKGQKDINLDERISILNKKLIEKQQYLQNFRNLLSNPGFLNQATQQVIDDKKSKMDEVKKSIVELEHEINRLKMIKK